MRTDGRRTDQLRPVSMVTDYIKWAEGSVLIATGDTKVICTASVEDKVPPWLKGAGQGWVTGEYGMLPRSTAQRNLREAARGHVGGRTQEIQRLIGRSLRSVVELGALGERTVFLDCDVIQADGGTRTAAISGAFVALILALRKLKDRGDIEAIPVSDYVAAVSVGIVDGEMLLDLSYDEDSRAAVDFNLVMTGKGEIIEIQGTGEKHPFGRKDLDNLIELASSGIQEIIGIQREVLGEGTEGFGP